jgi:hypothetical protein
MMARIPAVARQLVDASIAVTFSLSIAASCSASFNLLCKAIHSV